MLLPGSELCNGLCVGNHHLEMRAWVLTYGHYSRSHQEPCNADTAELLCSAVLCEKLSQLSQILWDSSVFPAPRGMACLS